MLASSFARCQVEIRRTTSVTASGLMCATRALPHQLEVENAAIRRNRESRWKIARWLVALKRVAPCSRCLAPWSLRRNSAISPRRRSSPDGSENHSPQRARSAAILLRLIACRLSFRQNTSVDRRMCVPVVASMTLKYECGGSAKAGKVGACDDGQLGRLASQEM